MAEAVFRLLTNNLPPTSPSKPSGSTLSPPHPLISNIDSAGTGAYHTLEPPDPRTHATLLSHNVRGYDHGARKITARDFEDFDYILAMDSDNLRDLQEMKTRLYRRGVPIKAELRLFGEFGGRTTSAGGNRGGSVVGEEVVDPYYGADNGFEVVYEQVERFSKAFLRGIENKSSKDNENREADGERS